MKVLALTETIDTYIKFPKSEHTVPSNGKVSFETIHSFLKKFLKIQILMACTFALPTYRVKKPHTTVLRFRKESNHN